MWLLARRAFLFSSSSSGSNAQVQAAPNTEAPPAAKRLENRDSESSAVSPLLAASFSFSASASASACLSACPVPKVCPGRLQNNGALELALGFRQLALVQDGSDSRGPAQVTGPPVQRQPAVSMHSRRSTPRLRCMPSAAASSVLESGSRSVLLVQRTISRTRPACRCPQQAPFPAPAARNTSRPPSHARPPSSATASCLSTYSCHQFHSPYPVVVITTRSPPPGHHLLCPFALLLLLIGPPVLNTNTNPHPHPDAPHHLHAVCS